MENIIIRLATPKDAPTVKNLINQMYGIEYETREDKQISEAIKKHTEIYFLAFNNSQCIGFSGASLNNDYYKDVITPDIAVIDYIFINPQFADFGVSFNLILELIKRLVEINVNSAILQVQTSNKQRFFHYALSDKNIIKTEPIEQHGKPFEDQILLIKDLKQLSKITMKELMQKAYYFKNTEIKHNL